ncbi:unnamed protein product, partial [Chrysoparadoxa australica]
LQLLAFLGLSDREMTVVVLGLDNAGKSTLLRKLATGGMAALQPTERPNLETFELGGIKFKAWDLGGHEAVRCLWDDYLCGAQGVLFILDSSDQERLEEASEELHMVLQAVGRSEKVPVAVCYNKCDLKASLPSSEIEKVPDAAGPVVRSFRTSALTGHGYTKAFQWLAHLL